MALCALLPTSEGATGLMWVALALILLGIPHGASDYLVFRSFAASAESRRVKLAFYLYYFLGILLYGILWMVAPTLAFIGFILVSVYHFGQSNWHQVCFESRWQAKLTYLLWGGFVLAFPILLHHQEAAVIVKAITGYDYALSAGWRHALLFLSLCGNLIVLCHLNERHILSDEALERELVNLLLLALLFAATPLLIGFATYFVIWHSLAATLDQIRLFRELYGNDYSHRMYLKQVGGMTALALAGLGALAYCWPSGAGGAEGIDWSIVFLFISIITTPHALLIDRLYEWAQRRNAPVNQIKFEHSFSSN